MAKCRWDAAITGIPRRPRERITAKELFRCASKTRAATGESDIISPRFRRRQEATTGKANLPRLEIPDSFRARHSTPGATYKNADHSGKFPWAVGRLEEKSRSLHSDPPTDRSRPSNVIIHGFVTLQPGPPSGREGCGAQGPACGKSGVKRNSNQGGCAHRSAAQNSGQQLRIMGHRSGRFCLAPDCTPAA